MDFLIVSPVAVRCRFEFPDRIGSDSLELRSSESGFHTAPAIRQWHRIFQMLLRRRGLHIWARGESAYLLRRSQSRRLGSCLARGRPAARGILHGSA